jgi:ubiquinone/menaquinone biosynthesis C-methylase UbiE
MTSFFDPIQYKINTRLNWNTIAPLYHKNWASTYIGPFKSTIDLVKSANITSNDIILDLACGTGAVSNEISRFIGNNLNANGNSKGILIDVDISRSALLIAKSSKPSYVVKTQYIELDEEYLRFRKSFFNKILCQFGMMFFPNILSVLKALKDLLMKGGLLSIAVHGTSDRVPYFSCIMNSILKHIPDIRQNGSPSVHILGNYKDVQYVK